MAGLRKLKGKYYIRIRLPGKKEKLIPTMTGDERLAKKRLKIIEEKEFLVRARIISESELEDIDLVEGARRFLAHCKQKGLRPATLISYKAALGYLAEVFNPVYPVRGIGREHITKLTEMLLEKGSTGNSVNIALRSIKAFLSWLKSEKYILEAPKIDLVKVDNSLPKFLTPDELTRIYAYCTSPKLLATFRVYESLGLRLSELHNSELEGDFVKVSACNAKGRKDRFIPLPEAVRQDYFTATTDPYRTDYITKSFHKLALKAGIDHGKTFHSLRHTFALKTLLQTNNLNLVKELLGHSQITTTMIYTKFPKEYLKEILTERLTPAVPVAAA